MWYEKKGNLVDYRKVKSHVYNNKSFHSKKEAAFAQELDIRKKAGDIEEYDRQVKIDLRVNNAHICYYYVDFLLYHKDGTKEYIEVKGFETEVWRLKWKLFEALYGSSPDTKLTVVR